MLVDLENPFDCTGLDDIFFDVPEEFRDATAVFAQVNTHGVRYVGST